jgi:hypothetical protein
MPALRRYEYKVIPEDDLGVQSTREDLAREARLNIHGTSGWELVAVTPSRLYIFKRRADGGRQ